MYVYVCKPRVNHYTETMRDTADVLGRLCDMTLARVFAHSDVEVCCVLWHRWGLG